jgi:hypothetical protein
MTCKTCGSDNLRDFSAEIGIHFPGLKNVDKPAVVIHPKVVVCLKCGIAEFAIPEAERRELA